MNNSIYINKKDLYEEMNIIKNKYDPSINFMMNLSIMKI